RTPAPDGIARRPKRRKSRRATAAWRDDFRYTTTPFARDSWIKAFLRSALIMRAWHRSRLTVLAPVPENFRSAENASKHLLATPSQSCILDAHSIRRLQEAARQ